MSEKKALPKIESPSIVTTLPISKKKVSYRPFVVKEQKAMLLAQASEDRHTINATISDVVNSCTNGSISLGDVPFGDISFLFLQIANASTGPEHKVAVICENAECQHEFIMMVMLDQVTVPNPDVITRLMVTPTVGIVMRIPTYPDLIFMEENADNTVGIIYHLIESIFDEDQVYSKDDYSFEEFSEWFDGFNDTQLKIFDTYVDGIPDLKHTFNYHCPKCKTDHSKPVEGLLSFFRIKSGEFIFGRHVPVERSNEDGVQLLTE